MVVVAEDAVMTIVPTVAFPPAAPLTVNVTDGDALPAPLTVAVKTSEPPAGTLLETGARLTAIVEGVCTGAEDSVGADVLPHAESNSETASPGHKMLRMQMNTCAAAKMRQGLRMNTCMRQGLCHCGSEIGAPWRFSRARHANAINFR